MTENINYNGEDVFLAVKEPEIEKLALSIMTIADNVSLIFEKIDQKYELLKENLDCNALNKIEMKYREIRKNYATIKKNINSYADDMTILIQKVNQGSKVIANTAKQENEEIINVGRREF